jgi:hypothetical protein
MNPFRGEVCKGQWGAAARGRMAQVNDLSSCRGGAVRGTTDIREPGGRRYVNRHWLCLPWGTEQPSGQGRRWLERGKSGEGGAWRR